VPLTVRNLGRQLFEVREQPMVISKKTQGTLLGWHFGEGQLLFGVPEQPLGYLEENAERFGWMTFSEGQV
jgi:hypothetical protein